MNLLTQRLIVCFHITKIEQSMRRNENLFGGTVLSVLVNTLIKIEKERNLIVKKLHKQFISQNKHFQSGRAKSSTNPRPKEPNRDKKMPQ